MTTAIKTKAGRWVAALAAALSVLALTGCRPPKDDEATQKYQGPGQPKAGAPSMSPSGPPMSKK